MVSMIEMEMWDRSGRLGHQQAGSAKKPILQPDESTKGYFRVQPKQVPIVSRPTTERLSTFLKQNSDLDIDQNGNILDRNFNSMQNSDPSPEEVERHRNKLLAEQLK